jgi:predicted kinase
LIVLRGPAGAGKTTLARSVQAEADRLTAVIDTDIFNWEIVPGESNKELVFRNVVMLAENYLRYGYDVIVCGLIVTSEELGAMDRLRKLALIHNAVFADFYCAAPRDVVLERSRARLKDVPEDSVLQWWELAESDRENVEWNLIELDMRNDLPTLTAQVFVALETGSR